MSAIRSRDNPRVKRWARLSNDSRFRRAEQCAIVEGPHLVAEALKAGIEPLALIVSEAGLERTEIRDLVSDRNPLVLTDAVFSAVADVETPPGIAAEIPIPHRTPALEGASVFLEGIQDPSNVGAILRTAAAFGVGEAVLDRACADAWSPKALRADMGGHFKLSVRQVTDLPGALDAFGGRLLCTVLTDGVALPQADLQGQLGWIFGAEGRGVSPALTARAAQRIRIPMTAGSESLNVAAAAAICLYEAFRRRPPGSAQ